MNRYQVVETFSSINGEGRRAGELAYFIRLKGCNLSCAYCDTSWANAVETEAVSMTKEEIAKSIAASGITNVTVTGGEPLLAPDIRELFEYLLLDPRLFIEVETNGSIDLTSYRGLSSRVSMTMDYKLPGSGMEGYMRTENFACLCKLDTVKFVAGNLEDLWKAKELIEEYQLTKCCNVYLSPVFGKISPVELVNFMMEHRMNHVNMQLQMHKIIWDPNKRGV